MVKTFQHYDFQQKASSDISGHITYFYNGEDVDNFLICLPTGAGKTFVTAVGLKDFLDKNPGTKILFVVNLQCLVSQTYETFEAINLDSSVVHNDLTHTRDGEEFKMGFGGRVVITMPETYLNIISGDSEITIPDNFNPVSIIFDEAHKATSEINQLIVNYHDESLIVGLTASPHRPQNKDGEHLYHWYGDNLYQYISIQELIELGRLVQPKYYQFNEDDNIVTSWIALCKEDDSDNQQTVVFTQNTDQSLRLKEAFINAGYAAEIITSGSTVNPNQIVKPQLQKERDKIYKKFRERKLQILISVNALCEGWDEPSARICIYARKVQNRAFYQQIGGRVMRVHESKNDAILMDFHGNVEEFGPIEHIQWNLGDDYTIKTVKENEVLSNESAKRQTKIFYTCTCHHVYDLKKNHSCPSCNRKTTVRIVESIVESLSSNLPDVDLTKIKDIKSALSSIIAANNIPKDEMGVMFRNKINTRYKAEIFDASGDLTETFSWISKVKDVNSVKKTTQLDLI